jgi:hypothetical protein
MKEPMIKLESINCWAGELGIMNCDDNGLPIMEESRNWTSLDTDWFQNLSTEDKEKVNKLINKETNNV